MKEGFGVDSASLFAGSFLSFLDTMTPNTNCEVLNMPYEEAVTPAEMFDAMLSLLPIVAGGLKILGGLKRLGSLNGAGGMGRDGKR